MRILALLDSVANGGRFIQIVDSESHSKERELRIIPWKPTEVQAA